MNSFEDNLREISKQDINIPKSYEESISDALNYISNMEDNSDKKLFNKRRNIVSSI